MSKLESLRGLVFILNLHKLFHLDSLFNIFSQSEGVPKSFKMKSKVDPSKSPPHLAEIGSKKPVTRDTSPSGQFLRNHVHIILAVSPGALAFTSCSSMSAEV